MTRFFWEMTEQAQIIGQEDFIDSFSETFERMIVKMKEVDDWCVEVMNDISHQELSLVGFIGDHGDSIMRDIANYMDVPFSTATGIVEKLVQKGYLKRYHSEDDRRIVLVSLEKKGKDTHELFSSKKREMSTQVMSALTPDEQKSLISLFEKIAAKI